MEKQEMTEEYCPNCRRQMQAIQRIGKISDILKALDCCIKGECSSCPYCVLDNDASVCMKFLFSHVYDALVMLAGQED